jgi:signal transduction histidine kinase
VLELVEEASPQLHVHPALFAIVVANLVRNATAHTENGTVKVCLAINRLVVSDTGIGIRGDEIGRVFQRYYRGAESRGSGIGLSLVKRICDRQGWQILLESREGEGTTATLDFS